MKILRLHKYLFPLLVWVLLTAPAQARNTGMLHCDLGIQGGCGYYVGDATPHIFTNVREAYGAFFRYRFTQRWALQLQGNTQRLVGYNPDGMGFADKSLGTWTNQLANLDLTAEYNFFRFDQSQYDARVKTYTPYIGLGIGLSVHSQWTKVSGYIPFVVGFKWKFAPRCNLQIAWQHNVYFSDNLENVPEYDNLHKLNGSNILNNDVTGHLILGLSVAFAAEKKVCRLCNPND